MIIQRFTADNFVIFFTDKIIKKYLIFKLMYLFK